MSAIRVTPDAGRSTPSGPAVTIAALVAGFAAAVELRVAVGGADVAHSAGAGVVFAAALLVLTAAGGVRLSPSRWPLAFGFAGAAVLLVPALLARLGAAEAHRPAGSFPAWAVVVTVVAAAEEVFLRGALFDAIITWRKSPELAVAVGAVCFAGLHIPLYGWSSVPLDLAVGCCLGTLRILSGTPGAPAIAHALADLAGWWLR